MTNQHTDLLPTPFHVLSRLSSSLAAFATLALGLFVVPPAQAAGRIVITFNAGYNLVVDSNVCSPSTYAPRIATNGVAFCNYGDQGLTDVVAYIGDFAAGTPSIYPTRDSATAAGDACATSPCLCDSGLYSLTHIGDPVDAIRYIGDLDVGECSWQYWSFTYPRKENPDTCGDPVWCDTNNPNDDLWLAYDVWATSAEGEAANSSRTVTMRNEISASANKIYPNNGSWFNQPEVCQPGQIVVTNGINYELGVVNKGFDNDGDTIPDYNAWLQPIGDEGWNPACFRLVETSGQLIVSRPSSGCNPSNPPPNGCEYVDFQDQLYFTDLQNNNGVIGVVEYTFMCLGGACEVPMTPYQEAASGFDNEKFAGDYGASGGRLIVTSPEITLEKSILDASGDGIAQENEVLSYTVDLANTGTADLGVPSLGVPLVVKDSIPADTSYVAGSAAYSFACCAGQVSILYSFDNRISWTSTEPVAASVTDIQWRFEVPFPAGATGNVSFDVRVDQPYIGDPVILNTAEGSFGDSAPFAEDTVGIPIAGNNSIGDTIFADDGGSAGFLAPEASNGIQDAGVSEGGIGSITVTLYWDQDGDGILDSNEMAVLTTSTAADGSYLLSSVPDGDWIVVVDTSDSDLPAGYRSTTPTHVVVNDLGVGTASAVSFLDADFGFGPTLVVNKSASLASQCGENNLVSYEIAVTNNRPADSPCEYTAWAENLVPAAGKVWNNEPGAVGAGGPDGSFAQDAFDDATDRIQVGTWTMGSTPPGNIAKVEALFWVYFDGAFTNDNVTLELYEAGSMIGSYDLPQVPECNDGSDNDGDTATDYPADAQCASATAGTEDGLINEAMNAFQPGSSNGGFVVWDVTAERGSWSYADFSDPTVAFELAVAAKKAGSWDNVTVYLDAVGFRVTTDRLCGAPGDDLSVVSLEDQFDAAASPGATFVSSTACGVDTDGVNGSCGDADDRYLFPTSQTSCAGPSATCKYASTGILRWADIGPLLAGETKTFSVTLAVPNATAGSVLGDWALSCGTAGGCQNTFFDGTAANNHEDEFGCTLVQTWAIGDLIWNDINSDQSSAGEPGIPGVTVRLYRDTDSDGTGDILLATTTTDGSGAYLFPALVDNVVGEQYLVVVDSNTIPDSTPNRTYDLDGTGTPDQAAVTLSGADNLNVDFGYNINNMIFGNVWYDYNGNGTRNAEDYGLGDGSSFVRVELLDGSCDPLPAPNTCPLTYTDANGDYVFSELANGSYQVRVDTTTLAGTWTQTADPDATLDHQTTSTIALTGGTVAGSYDFGYTQTNPGSSIGDTLFRDWDGDGTQDAGDTGIAGITVYLYQDNGDGVFDPISDTRRGTDVTDASGIYGFSVPLNCGTDSDGDGDPCEATDPPVVAGLTGLPAGNWWVFVNENDLPRGFGNTGDPDEAGTCSVCDAVGGVTTNGVNDDLTIDFGYQPGGFASIGDTVWEDADADGIQDAGEAGIGSITVNLYVDINGDGALTAADALLATTVTDGDGSYLFENLYGDSSVTYLVDVDQTDANLPTDCGDDFNCATTSDNNRYVLTSECTGFGTTCSGSDPIAVTLSTNNEAFLGADFGFGPGGVIGDTVFQDFNGDGVYSPTIETGISGLTITLRNCGVNGTCGDGDDTTTTTTTDANGQYLFTGLPEGTYRVEVTTLPPCTNCTQTYDRDVSPPTCTGGGCDNQTTVDLNPGQTILFADFGYQPPGSIGDTIWYDENGDGIQDPGEAGIAGVQVTLSGAATGTTTTDADGLYVFTSLAAGSYTVTVNTSTLPGGAAAWNQTGDPDEAGTCAACDSLSSFAMDASGNVAGGNFVFDFGYDQVPASVITIDKDTTTPTSAPAGQATFTIVARNGGTSAGQLVRFHDDLTVWGSGSCTPNCATLADLDPGPGCTPAFSVAEVNATRVGTTSPTCGANNLTWLDWTIQPGGSVTITYTVDLASNLAVGTYDNTADGGYDSDNNGSEDTTFDDIGTSAQDTDTPAGQDPEADEDVTIEALPVLNVTKSCAFAAGGDSNGNGLVDPNDLLEFTIVVTNNGLADASIFSVSDPVPTGTTYAAGTSDLVSVPDWINVVTYADDFDAGTSDPPRSDDNAFPGGDDTVPSTDGWIGLWSAGGASAISDLGDISLEIGRNENPARAATINTTIASRAILTFDYRRVNFDSADTLDILVCGTTVLTIDGDSDGGSGSDFTDSNYVSRSVDVTSALRGSGSCSIQFDANAYSDSTGESIFIDNVSLERKLRTTLGPLPANAPSLLVPAADYRELLPTESMTVRFRVTADNPLPVGLASIVNTVFSEATELADPVTDTCSMNTNIPPVTGSISGTVWDDFDVDGVLDGTESRLVNIPVALWTDPNGDGDPADGTQALPVVLTDANGAYSYSNLPAGNYVVVVDETILLQNYPSYRQSGDPDEGAAPCSTCDGRAILGPVSLLPLGAGENRTAVDFGYYHFITPLPVTLASFSASFDAGQLVFEWSTATEVGNVGFFIYGWVNDEWLQVNEELIPSQVIDSTEPRTYSYEVTDFDAASFLLVDVDLRGRTKVHGPFEHGVTRAVESIRGGNTIHNTSARMSVQTPGPPKTKPIRWSRIRDEHQNKKRGRSAARNWKRRGKRPERETLANFSVVEEGLHRVTFRQLAAAGIDLTSVPPAQIALFNGNEPVPIHIERARRRRRATAIVFVGHTTDSLYTDTNIYTLRIDPGNALRVKRDHSLTDGASEVTTTAMETVRLEQNRAYSFSSPNGDPWYDAWAMAFGQPASVSRTMTVSEVADDPRPATVTVELWGVTDWPQSPDHHVQVAFNGGLPLADEIFDGQQALSIEAEIPSDMLLEGLNEVSITLPNDVGVDWDIVALESTAVTYPRRLIAQEGRLTFDGDVANNFRVSGVPSPDVSVFRLRGNRVEWLTRPAVARASGSFDVTFAGASEPATYMLSTGSAFLTPGIAYVESHPELLVGSAEYLIITHPDFADDLEALVQAREAQGLRVKVVNVEHIYAQFSGGVVDAEAIRDYVGHAARELGAEYLLLVGGDSFDYKDYLGLGAVSFIPSLYVPSGDIVRFAPADPLYGDVDDDGVPDLAVGRLPVRTTAELESVLSKMLAYEDKTYGPSVLSASDAYDAGAGISFMEASEMLLSQLDESWRIERADIDLLGLSGARKSLIANLNEGVSLAQFFGHSAPTLWSFQRLFTANDAAALENEGRPAVIVQWGCWNTYYVDPTLESMGNTLMLSGDRGAAAVLGAATLTDVDSDLELGSRLLPKMVLPGMPIGKALLEAKRELAAEHPEMSDVVIGWTILGDPALVVHKGDEHQ